MIALLLLQSLGTRGTLAMNVQDGLSGRLGWQGTAAARLSKTSAKVRGSEPRRINGLILVYAYSSSAQSRTCSSGDDSHTRNLNSASSGLDSRGIKLLVIVRKDSYA